MSSRRIRLLGTTLAVLAACSADTPWTGGEESSLAVLGQPLAPPDCDPGVDPIETAELCSGTDEARSACFVVVSGSRLTREVGQTYRVSRPALPGRMRLTVKQLQAPTPGSEDDDAFFLSLELRRLEAGSIPREDLSTFAWGVIRPSMLVQNEDVPVEVSFTTVTPYEAFDPEAEDPAEYVVVMRLTRPDDWSVGIACHDEEDVYPDGNAISRQMRQISEDAMSDPEFVLDVRDLSFYKSVDNGCYSFGQTSCGTGACFRTVDDCLDGIQQHCTAGDPAPEVCNGIDDDCNGLVDDGLGNIVCGIGACQQVVPFCLDGEEQTCIPGEPEPEMCNGIDNDCDGEIDNGNPGGDEACGTGLHGVCAAGITACPTGTTLTGTLLDDPSHPLLICVPFVEPGDQVEVCDGLDNSCNGEVDDGNPGGGLDCDTGELGQCRFGTTDCRGGSIHCDRNNDPVTEMCSGVDDNCDGQIDEGFDQDGDGFTTCGTITPACCAYLENEHGVVDCEPWTGTDARCMDCNDNDDEVNPAHAEVCDGKDNNCSGEVDEGFDVDGDGFSTCGTRSAVCCAYLDNMFGENCGASAGTGLDERCIDCVDSDEEIHPWAEEICDGIDNNCTEQIDNLGSTTCGQGVCEVTQENCVGGVEVSCVSNDHLASPEVCNGLDDDCNGLVDDDLGFTTCGHGRCEVTQQNCVDGVEVACAIDWSQQQPEVCNGIDDDCDGVVDNDIASTTCGLGICQRTTNCEGGEHEECVPGDPHMVGGVPTEICNGQDSDCNGFIDDGLGQTTCGQGVCEVTVDNCVGGVTQSCVPNNHLASAEVCNGLDDDCNGLVDDGLGTTTCGVGYCQRTVNNCVGGVPQTCSPGAPRAEMCNNIDDNCDGLVDNLGTWTCGTGECQRTVQQCIAGVPQQCIPGSPSAEVCDGLDNNCNGLIDDGLPATHSCGLGQCLRTVAYCVSGSVNACVPGPSSAEVCNGIDNNCDGLVDNAPIDQLCPRTGPVQNVTSAVCNGASGCAVGNCAAGWFNVDGLWSNGCECQNTGGGSACGSPLNVGSLSVGSQSVQTGRVPYVTSTTSQGDFYQVTFPSATDWQHRQTGKRRIYFTSNPGNQFRFEVRTAACSSAANCGAGTGSSLTEWSFEDSCSRLGSSNNVGSCFGGRSWTAPTTVYVRVFRVGSTATCDSYSLRFAHENADVDDVPTACNAAAVIAGGNGTVDSAIYHQHPHNNIGSALITRVNMPDRSDWYYVSWPLTSGTHDGWARNLKSMSVSFATNEGTAYRFQLYNTCSGTDGSGLRTCASGTMSAGVTSFTWTCSGNTGHGSSCRQNNQASLKYTHHRVRVFRNTGGWVSSPVQHFPADTAMTNRYRLRAIASY